MLLQGLFDILLTVSLVRSISLANTIRQGVSLMCLPTIHGSWHIDADHLHGYHACPLPMPMPSLLKGIILQLSHSNLNFEKRGLHDRSFLKCPRFLTGHFLKRPHFLTCPFLRLTFLGFFQGSWGSWWICVGRSYTISSHGLMVEENNRRALRMETFGVIQ